MPPRLSPHFVVSDDAYGRAASRARREGRSVSAAVRGELLEFLARSGVPHTSRSPATRVPEDAARLLRDTWVSADDTQATLIMASLVRGHQLPLRAVGAVLGVSRQAVHQRVARVPDGTRLMTTDELRLPGVRAEVARVEDGSTRSDRGFNIDAETLHCLRVTSAELGVAMSDVVEAVLRRYAEHGTPSTAEDRLP